MSECRKRIKRLSNGWRILHIGDGNTNTKKDDILHLLSKLGCAFVTHYRILTQEVSKRYKVLPRTASIFCESERKSRIVENNCTFTLLAYRVGKEGDSRNASFAHIHLQL